MSNPSRQTVVALFREIHVDVQREFPAGEATYLEFVRCVRATIGRGLELGHYLDRLAMGEGVAKTNFLLVILSLTLGGSVGGREEVLHEVEGDVVEMVGYLQKTCQLVPDAQILETEVKYPLQGYKVTTPEEMVGRAREEIEECGLGREKGVDDFRNVLRSSAVCAWGECYGVHKLRKK